MVHQIFLAMLSKEVKFDLSRGRCPLEVIQCLRGFYLGPTRTRVQNSLDNFMVIPQEQDILVQLCRLLLVQREQVILCLDLSLGLQLLPQLLLFSTGTPYGSRLIVWVAVGPTHPLETAQLLVSVDLIVVLFFFILLLLLFLLFFCSLRSLTSSLCRLLALCHFLALSRTPISKFLRLAMTANVCHSLQFLLAGKLFSLLLLLLEFESLCGSFELLFVDDEEVTRPSFREIGLCQDVLHTCDRAHLALVIDVLELVHLIWLIDNSVTLLEVD